MSEVKHIVVNNGALLVLAPWLVVELAFLRVHLAALATYALKDIPLAPLIFTSLILLLLETSTVSIDCARGIVFTKRVRVFKNVFVNDQTQYIHL